MKSLLEKLNTSEDAVDFGKKATKDEVRLLKSLRDECIKIASRLMKLSMETPDDNKSLEDALKIGMKAQFCSEALQESKLS